MRPSCASGTGLSKLSRMRLLGGTRLSGELKRLQEQLERVTAEPTDDEIWEKVELARDEERPYTLDYVERLIEDWIELHGDRGRADDPAVVTGVGRFRGRTVVVIGNQKGRDVKERVHRNYGMANPEGYRKAMRAMELAERHRFPDPFARGHSGRVSGRRRGAARSGRRDRALAGDSCRACTCPSSRASSARAARVVRLRRRSPTRC